MNKDLLDITAQYSSSMEKLNYNQEIYKSFLSTTNVLVKGNSNFEITMIPKQNIINTLEATPSDLDDDVVKENIQV